MNELLESINNIGHSNAALCILKGLRSKIELHREQPNRITKHFPNLKIVMLIGRAGTGKTHAMRSIFDGLKLSKFTTDGTPSSVWLDGSATTVGRREKLKESPHSIIWWNEIQTNDISDVRLMKQISEGVISHYKHGDLEEVKFTGLLVGCSNDISAKGKVGKDLEALRDRMDVIHVGPPKGYDPKLAIEDKKHYLNIGTRVVDWGLIANSLSVKTDEVLSAEERENIKPFWLTKIRECLDNRVLTRAGNDFIDCFVFMKRLFSNYGGLADNDVFTAAIDLAYESVNLNPLSISNLTIIQKDIVDVLQIQDDKTCDTSEIKDWLVESGRFISKSTMHRNLNKLIEQGLILKRKHGEYSLLKQDKDIKFQEEQPFGGILDDLAR